MLRKLTILGVVLALGNPAPTAGAQQPGDGIPDEFAPIEASVIRIRTIADLDYGAMESEGVRGALAARPYSIDGTGIVVGETWVDGRLEYLILTNHHVADASNYVLAKDGYLRMNPTNTLAVPSVHEESYLMASATDRIDDTAIALVEVVRLVRGDMTLMRTVGANRDLTVFAGAIGYTPGDVNAGDPIVISGYPFGREMRSVSGTLVEIDYPHTLGLPHRDFVLSMPVQPGQSGGPIFRIEGNPQTGEPLSFRLIGLVHARDGERSFGVPYELWESSLGEFPAELLERLVR